MTRHLRLVGALLLATATAPVPALAAEPWGLENEKVVEIEGEVVDLACAVAGDCVAGCGEGRRQLGLVTAEGRLLPLAKGLVNFANGVPDLLPYCGRKVRVDGLLIESPAMPLLFVQNLRDGADAPWRPATAFERDWKAANGGADAAEWFRADPGVKSAIGAGGVYGIPGLKPE